MTLLSNLLQSRIKWALLTITTGVSSIVISLCWNAQLSRMVNGIHEKADISWQTMGMAVLFMCLSAGSAYGECLCAGWTCETLAHDLRMGYARHFLTMPITEAAHINAGATVSGLQNEVNEVSDYLCDHLFPLVNDFIRFVGTFGWMMFVDSKLTWMSCAPVAVLLVYTVCSSKVIGKTAHESQQANEIMNSFADTLISVFPILRIYDAVKMILTPYDKAFARWEAARIREERRRAGLMSLSAFMSVFPLLLLFLLGGAQIAKGASTVGTLYVFINLSGNISGIMMNMPGRIAGFRRFSANMDRLQPVVAMS